MEFTSTLTGDKYTYKNMNLLELRNKILKQENLTYLDILRGYVTKRTFNLEYEPIEVLSIEMETKIYDIIDKIVEEFFISQADKYIELQNRISNFEEEYKTFEISKEMTLVEYIKKRDEKLKNQPNTDFRNRLHKYIMSISTSSISFRNYSSNELIEFMNKKIVEELGSVYLFKNCASDDKETLPRRIDLLKLEDYDFSNKVSKIKVFTIDKTKPFNDERILFSFAPKNLYVYTELYLVKKITKEEAKSIVLNAVEKEISKEIKVNPFMYAQQLESMPITINIDTKTNKIYLIDGYKRLLYLNNEELLNKEVAVKVFYDLSSQSNIDLLYAANYWKKTLGDRQIGFHDRGFLFNLNQVYSINEKMYPYCFEYGSRNEQYSLLRCLELYDYTSDILYTLSTSYAKNKATKKGFYAPNEYMISDIKQMTNILDFKRKYEYLEIVNTWLVNDFVTILGYLRKDRTKEQKEINMKQVLEEIFNDEKMYKILSKKTGLSTVTYLTKYFTEKKIDEWIESIIMKHIY